MENRERILQVALDLFFEKGYDAVGVQEIVANAGITKPTLYYYFGSKYGLLEALLEQGFSNLHQDLQEAIAQGKKPSKDGDYDVPLMLFCVAKAFVSFAIREEKFYFFMLSLMYSAKGNEPYQAIKPHLHRLYRTIIDLFERLGDKLGNMNGRQESFAMGFLGFVNQYVFTHSEKQQEFGLIQNISDSQIYELVHQFMYGIVN